MDEMRHENNSTRDRLTQLETDRINLINEKDRKDRDCKNMQIELNHLT